jgi:serine/threonine protein kinase
MGEVYKARDTRLNRTVAVKVLPADFAADCVHRERFEREAKIIAALSHPHICALHDVGRQEGTDFLVMEHLDGETLEARLKKGALPLDQVFHIGIQIADALTAAHRAGIVHRDLKPGNIMLTRTGAKLLDFGLAKAAGPAVAGRLSMLPTTPPGLTQQGTILGTFQYMAPEQLEGHDADARTDIFAFGAVFYEMLAGRKAFEATSHAGLIAAILDRDPPPVSSVQPRTMPALDRIVAKCLAKDPEARWQTARDLHDELRWVAENRPASAAAAVDHPVRSRLRDRATGAVAALALVGAVAVVWLSLRSSAPPPNVTRFEVPTPPTQSVTSFALSPDGRQLAYVATTDGQSRLWLRPLNETAARPLAGTEGATFPFWAPGGRAIGFFAESKLKRLDLDGGAPQVLADTTPQARGGTWSVEDVILFTADAGTFRTTSVLMRVPASGGTPVPVTRLAENERSHRWPQFLPDGHRFLFFSALAGPDVQGVYLGSLDEAQPRRVLATDASVAFVPPDRLLFVRDDVLMAARFDPVQGTIAGEPQPVAQPVGRDEGTFSDMFSTAPDVLAYRPRGGGQRRQLVWMDRAGKVLESVGSIDESSMGSPELDHTGQRAAMTRVVLRNFDIWLMDASRGIPTRFTFDPAFDGVSVWSPDGRRMVFFSIRDGRDLLYEKSASGAGDERLVAADGGFPLSWSPDGRFVLYSRPDVKTGVDLWALPMTGEPKPFTVVQAASDQRGGEFSPDGRWLAYESNESGRFEVYVQPFPQAGGKWQASSAGGTQVRWRRDGRELYYVAPDARLMAVSVAASPDGKTLNLGVPVPLFPTRLATGASVVPGRPQYAVAPDGRFLMNTIVDNTSPSPITVIVNWTQLLEAR